MNQSAPAARRRRIALALFAVFLVPLALTAWVFYGLRPGGRPDYGTLVQPQRPVPALHLRTLAGKPVDLRVYDGYWLMLTVAPAACDAGCQTRLYDLRQFLLAAGEDRPRVARVWLIPDAAPVNPGVLLPARGTVMLRADPAELKAWMPLGSGETLQGPIWMVDPLGNLMLRFPSGADPFRTLAVIKKLLYNSEGMQPKHLEPLP